MKTGIVCSRKNLRAQKKVAGEKNKVRQQPNTSTESQTVNRKNKNEAEIRKTKQQQQQKPQK